MGAAAPHLEAKLRQTQLLGMLMERALHDRSADWHIRLEGVDHPLTPRVASEDVTFTSTFHSPRNFTGESVTFEIILNGESVYAAERTVEARAGDTIDFSWRISPYRLSLT